MSNENPPRRHTLNEWRRGFCELVAGRPFYVCPDNRDQPYEAGDHLVVREHSRGVLTGYVATFRIDWTARSTDCRGAYEHLIRAGVVILGLTLIDLARPSTVPAIDRILLATWPTRSSTRSLPS